MAGVQGEEALEELEEQEALPLLARRPNQHPRLGQTSQEAPRLELHPMGGPYPGMRLQDIAAASSVEEKEEEEEEELHHHSKVDGLGREGVYR